MAHQVCFIGAGAMGGATIRGLLRETVFAPDEIVACDPAQDLLKTLSGELSIDITADNVEGLKGARTVFLAIKPQHLEAVCAGIRPALQSDQLVISIVAGARLDTLCEYPVSYTHLRAHET